MLSVAPSGRQFRGLESNQHRRVQSPASYLLDDPGMGELHTPRDSKTRPAAWISSVAEEGLEPPRREGSGF